MTDPIYEPGTPEDIAELCKDRHLSVRQIMRFFSYSHLPDNLKAISREFYHLALDMLMVLPDDPELVVGLRKLLEAKDCFVRAAL